MRIQSKSTARTYLAKLVPILAVVAALAAAMLQLRPVSVDAAGPAYSGPTTEATGPAYFGPAPNPFPYCENPTYFDPFPENVTPIGRLDVTGSPNASVTTNGITMDFELTAEGNPDTQYPGFFPFDDPVFGTEGGPGDQPKGVEMASDDGATITLSEPMFYTQWVFTDVDRENEGFFVTPSWSDPAEPGQVALFGGDANFDFTGATNTRAVFNDTDTVAQPSEAIAGRAQVDFLGALDQITILRDTGSGQSGFAIGGGCSPIGVSKQVTSGPTWNGTGYDVTYTIRVRNNLPSSATLSADVAAALAAAESGTTTGTPVEINLTALTLEDLLVDPAFSSVTVVSNTNISGNVAVNPDYDGDTDANLIAAGGVMPPETEEEFVLSVRYVADPAGPLGTDCGAQFELENQATLSGIASGGSVADESDDGTDPDPGVDNGAGGVDDTTIIEFDCPPEAEPALEIVKTVVAAGTPCPTFASGVAGEGTPLTVSTGQTVTYCIAVRNVGGGDATNVVVTDPMAPAGFDGSLGTLAAGAEDNSLSFELTVNATTPTVNTATVNGRGPDGDLPPVDDTAVIDIPTIPPAADVSLVKGVSNRGPVAVGTTITYTLEISNAGPDAAQGVSLVDTPPAGVVLADLPVNADWTCTSVPPGPLRCSKLTPLALNETVTLTYTATVTAAAAMGVDLVNTAVVSSTTPDPDPTNNTDTEITRRPPPDETIPTVTLPIPTFTSPPPAPTAPPSPVAPPAAPPSSPPLAITGASSVALASASSLFVVLGGMLWVGARRHDEA